jgi:tetratricopeptide (TPR) repeat protein
MKKFYKRKWVRITAIFLILTMLVTYWAGTVTSIRISAEATNEAMRYLAENTEMMNKQRTERTWNLVRGLMRTEDIDECFLVASIYIGSARYEEALTYIDKCLRMCPQDERKDFYAELLTKKGCLLTLLGRNDEAVGVLDSVIECKPDSSDAYMVLIQIYYTANDMDNLEKTLAAYLEIAPEDSDMRATYIQALMSDGNVKEAEVQCGLLMEYDKDGTYKNDAEHALALIALGREDFTGAMKHLTKMTDYEEAFPDVAYDKGVCHMAGGDYDKAVEEFIRSINIGYMKQYCYYSRAVCKISQEEPDYEGTFNDLKAAIEYDEEDRNEETAQMATELINRLFEIKE